MTEVKKKKNEAVIKDKMHQTFSYRRQEVVQDMPMVAEFQNRWPALFTMSEVSKGNIIEQFKSFSFSVLNSTSDEKFTFLVVMRCAPFPHNHFPTAL